MNQQNQQDEVNTAAAGLLGLNTQQSPPVKKLTQQEYDERKAVSQLEKIRNTGQTNVIEETGGKRSKRTRKNKRNIKGGKKIKEKVKVNVDINPFPRQIIHVF
jgi:hypothetical protein